MKTHIVRIGNSRGIRIPKALLEQTGLDGEVDISHQRDSLLIRPARRPRTNWAKAFREMARRRLLDRRCAAQSVLVGRE